MSRYKEAILDLQRKTALNVYEMLINGQPLYQVWSEPVPRLPEVSIYVNSTADWHRLAYR